MGVAGAKGARRGLRAAPLRGRELGDGHLQSAAPPILFFWGRAVVVHRGPRAAVIFELSHESPPEGAFKFDVQDRGGLSSRFVGGGEGGE